MSALLQLCMMSDVTEDYVATYLLNDQLLQIPSLENHLQLFLPKVMDRMYIMHIYTYAWFAYYLQAT